MRAEGANAQDVGDGVGIPALGEHGDGDNAADGLTQLAFLADGVHDLAQDVGVGDLAGLLHVAPFDHFAAEALDLVGGHFAEILVEGIAGFELLTVNEQGAGPGKTIAVVVVVAEQGETASVVGRRFAILARAGEAGDVVVNQFGGRGVVTDDDEDGGHAGLLLLPEGIGLFVVAVEGVQGGVERGREAERVEAG